MKLTNALPAAALALIFGASGAAIAQQSPATSTTPSTPATSTTQPAPAPGQAATTTTTTTTTTARYTKLDDMKVVGTNGEKIGEISDVLIDSSGKIVAVAVEAGGFLGMGDKDVIVGFDQLRFDGNRFVTSMTKEQMKALPEWKD